MKILLLLSFIASSLGAVPQPKLVPQKKIQIVTTIEVLAALSREIGKDHIQVHSLSTAEDDPHFVKAKPSFKNLVSKADLFIQIGRSLELWAPLVVTSSGNKKLVVGKGLIEASKGTALLEVPSELSRAHGDIHPEGNPHVWLSPSAALIMAQNIRDALIKTDPKNKSSYEQNFADFNLRLATKHFGEAVVQSSKANLDRLWDHHKSGNLPKYVSLHKLALGGWLKQAESIDYSFFTYHTVFSYLAQDFGLKIVGQIEEKSGVAPGLRYQNLLVKKALQENIKHIVAAKYYVGQTKLLDTIASKIKGKKVFVDVDCARGASYFDMMDNLLSTLVKFK